MAGFHPPAETKVVAVKPAERIKLLKSLELGRNEEVVLDGRGMPKSVSVLLSMLSCEIDSDERYDLYEHIVLECQLAERPELEVEFANKQYLEFGDITSLARYSHALISNGQYVVGITATKDALDMAIRDRALINSVAVDYIRESIRTRSVDAVSTSLAALIESTSYPRTIDSVLELEWMGDAEALGADKELFASVRLAADKKFSKPAP